MTSDKIFLHLLAFISYIIGLMTLVLYDPILAVSMFLIWLSLFLIVKINF